MRHSTWEDEEDWEYTALPSLRPTDDEFVSYTQVSTIPECLSPSPLVNSAAASMAIMFLLSGLAQMLAPQPD